MLNPPTSDPRSAFCQAESLAARITTILRPECRPSPERQRLAQHPFPDEGIREVLERIPGCEGMYDAVREAPAGQLKPLEHRLCAALSSAESKNPTVVEELECLVSRTVCFDEVWAEELEDVEKLRNLRKQPGEGREYFSGETALDTARNAELCGLSFSGGGVRSATFNLGILQGMAKTVCCGGWITCPRCPAAGISVDGDGVDQAERIRQCAAGAAMRRPRSTVQELEPIAFLRDYSSYLTPNKGLFTGDTWTAAMTWVRNTLLNLIVLLSVLAALLLAPHLPVAFIERVTVYLQSRGHGWEELITLVALAFQVWVILRVIHNLNQFGQSAAEARGKGNANAGFGDSLAQVRKFIIVPSLVSAWLCASRLWTISRETEVNALHIGGVGMMVLVCFSLLVTLQVRGGYIECYLREKKRTRSNRLAAHSLCVLLPLITTVVKVSILWGVYQLFRQWAAVPGGLTESHEAVWGMPLILGDYAICIALHIGLMGRYLSDDRREWWSRVAAYLGICALGICALCMACFYAPGSPEFPCRQPSNGWPRCCCGRPLRRGRDCGGFEERYQTRAILSNRHNGGDRSVCFHGRAVHLGLTGSSFGDGILCEGLENPQFRPRALVLRGGGDHRVFDGTGGGCQRVLDARF